MQERRDEQSLGELFADLARDTSTLVRQEMELAKTEMSQKASRVGRDITFLTVGGVVVYTGLLAIVAAIIIGLAQLGLPAWLSALVVGLVIAGVGYFLMQKGRDALKREDLAPRQTIETLKENAEWAKEQTH